MPDEQKGPSVCVVAPSSMLMVEIERAEGADGDQEDHAEIHVHAGGQGLWAATMVKALGARASVLGPFGGEAGDILRQLTATDGIEVIPIDYAEGNAALVHDRRSGEREEVASMPAGPLGRHETDEFFGGALVAGAQADVCLLTGSQPPDLIPADFFSRLAHDLSVSEALVVADLSGRAALQVAAEGPTLLKMAHDEVVEVGLAEDDSVDSLLRAARELVGQGVGTVVVSRADDPTLVVRDDGAWLVHTPPLSTVDHRGAGDSMTAGMAVGLGRGLPVLEAVRLGAAAGTLNVTRRGLGTGHRAQIEQFAERVEIEELD